MGVDAEMFVRIGVGEKHLTESMCLDYAARMAATIGADKFFIQHEELSGTKQTLFGEKPHHALSIMAPIKDEQDAEDHGLDSSHVGRVVWVQDGEPIVAGAGEQFIKVHMWTRYYGPDYERGDWKTIHATIRWLWSHIPRGQVYYGGDSSGFCAVLMTDELVAVLDSYFLTHGHQPYRAYGGRVSEQCRCCHAPMINVGGCHDQYVFYVCDGCGWKAVKHADGRLTWREPLSDFFDLTRTEAP